MAYTETSDEGLPIGRCDSCGDRQELHCCPRCDLDICDECFGKHINTGPCTDCLETYPGEFMQDYPDFYEEQKKFQEM